jgi:hypothetical protein
MKVEVIPTRKGELSLCRPERGERIEGTQDFLDLMGSCPSDTLVLEKESICPAFFDLKSGVAGDILQKVSNYQRRLAILGDFRSPPGKALRDFIYESNRTGQVVFAADLEGAVELLR